MPLAKRALVEETIRARIAWWSLISKNNVSQWPWMGILVKNKSIIDWDCDVTRVGLVTRLVSDRAAVISRRHPASARNGGVKSTLKSPMRTVDLG